MDFNSYSTSAVNMDHYWIAHLTIQYNNHSQLTKLGSQLQNHNIPSRRQDCLKNGVCFPVMG